MGIIPFLPLISGLLGSASASADRRRADWMNSPAGIRENAEAAGFNPLVFAGAGTGTGAQYAPTMGSIISNTGAQMAANFQEESAQKIQLTALDQENERLNKLVEKTTLRTPIAGIYGDRSNESQSQTDSDNSGKGLSGNDSTGASTGFVDHALGDINPNLVDEEDIQDRNIHLGKYLTWHVNPHRSTAQQVEDEMGEAASMLYPLAAVPSDIGYQVSSRTERFVRSVKDDFTKIKKWYNSYPQYDQPYPAGIKTKYKLVN